MRPPMVQKSYALLQLATSVPCVQCGGSWPVGVKRALRRHTDGPVDKDAWTHHLALCWEADDVVEAHEQAVLEQSQKQDSRFLFSLVRATRSRRLPRGHAGHAATPAAAHMGWVCAGERRRIAAGAESGGGHT